MSGETLTSKLSSSYGQYLPALLQEDDFLDRFLLAFEHILSGLPSTTQAAELPAEYQDILGFEEEIDKIHSYFIPVANSAVSATPKEFLPWLAGWVALSLRDDWGEAVQRSFIQRILSLYKIRGTKAALEQMLKVYLDNEQETVNIYEFDQPAHYFQVELALASQDLANYRRKEKVARAIINQEKPAHTFYSLRILMPTMRLVSEGENRLILGRNTILGNTTISAIRPDETNNNSENNPT